MSVLRGIRVIELEGIGPGPLGGCVLADFGADVVSVSRFVDGKIHFQGDPASRGKRSIALDLKSAGGLSALRRMAAQADVFIEPFRPGVAEKLGVGPGELCRLNPRLVYARMTGWGQGGVPSFEKLAGHDANYLSLSGALSLFRRDGERPSPPANFAGDYAGGGMMLAFGVVLALFERTRSGRGQVIDAAMVDGANYVALPLFKMIQAGSLRTLADKSLDTQHNVIQQAAPWFSIYECKDAKWVSVQAMEVQFYDLLLRGLGLKKAELPKRGDRAQWPRMKAQFAAVFRTKTRDEWAQAFDGVDACVAPVLAPEEAARHPHNVARGSFAPTPGKPGQYEPAPAPKLSRTPGAAPRPEPRPGGDTREVMKGYGFSAAEVAGLLRSGAAGSAAPRAAL